MKILCRTMIPIYSMSLQGTLTKGPVDQGTRGSVVNADLAPQT